MSEKTKSGMAAGAFVLVTLFFCVALGYYFGNNRTVEPNAGGFSGQPAARMATSSTLQVGPQLNKTLFALNTSCAARVVSTMAQGIMLTFDGVAAPGGATGHWQAGSTTIAYAAHEFGCGAVAGYAGASTTITISESNR
jgi:hypothetical protein